MQTQGFSALSNEKKSDFTRLVHSEDSDQTSQMPRLV